MTEIKAIVTAGGSSSRFGGTNKLLSLLRGKPVIQYSVDLFTEMGFEVIIPANKSAIPDYESLFKNYSNVKITEGGSSRQNSIKKALDTISECSLVIIHDAARPLIKKEVIQNCIEAAKKYGGAIAAVKTVDTIKEVSADKMIIKSLNRENLINVQTPQVFDFLKIKELHQKYSDKTFTDDSLLFETERENVYFVESDYSNIKITTSVDLKLAELLLEQ